MKTLLVIKMKDGSTKSVLLNSNEILKTINLLKNAIDGDNILKTIKIAPIIIFNKNYPEFEERIVELFGEISVEELFDSNDELDGLSPFIYSNPTDDFAQYVDDNDEYETVDELLDLYEEYIRARWPFNG